MLINHNDINEINYEIMASITIRNLDEEVKQRLKERAAEKGHSMEQEARHILSSTLDAEPPMASEPLAIYGKRRLHKDRDEVSRQEIEHYRKIAKEEGFYASIRAIVDKYGPVEIDIPPRVAEPFRNPFEGWEDDHS
jgi:plasmid stability protein